MPENILLEKLEIFNLAMEIGDIVWRWTERWNLLALKTIGEQIIRSSDSIASNIAEGYGRYYFKDRRKFCFYARGSLMETKIWAIKSLNRGLILSEEFEVFISKLKVLHLKLNIFIKSLKRNISEE